MARRRPPAGVSSGKGDRKFKHVTIRHVFKFPISLPLGPRDARSGHAVRCAEVPAGLPRITALSARNIRVSPCLRASVLILSRVLRPLRDPSVSGCAHSLQKGAHAPPSRAPGRASPCRLFRGNSSRRLQRRPASAVCRGSCGSRADRGNRIFPRQRRCCDGGGNRGGVRACRSFPWADGCQERVSVWSPRPI